MFFGAARKDGQASRQRILAEIAADPGVHVSELGERTGLSWHTIAYHLRILARAHAISVDKGQRERRVFPAGIPAAQRAWLAALRGARAHEVLRHLLDDPRQGITSLSRRMGFSEKIVRRQVARLAEAGLVDRRGQVRPVYELNQAAVHEVEDWLRVHGTAQRGPVAPEPSAPGGPGDKLA